MKFTSGMYALCAVIWLAGACFQFYYESFLWVIQVFMFSLFATISLFYWSNGK